MSLTIIYIKGKIFFSIYYFISFTMNQILYKNILYIITKYNFIFIFFVLSCILFSIISFLHSMTISINDNDKERIRVGLEAPFVSTTQLCFFFKKIKKILEIFLYIFKILILKIIFLKK